MNHPYQDGSLVTMHIFDIWHYVTSILFVALFLAVAIALFTAQKRRTLIFIVVCMFVNAVLHFSLTFLIRESLARSISEYSFVIEADRRIDKDKLLSSIANKRYVYLERTQPLIKSKVRVVIHTGEIELLVAQDSKDATLFWVYYPRWAHSRKNAIGKIRILKSEK